MRVGIDFDNTAVLYDELFHRVAVERYGMPDAIAAQKREVRAWFWSREGGNDPWTELQGIVYGTRLQEAEVAPGLVAFLRECRKRAWEVAIISHKTEFPAQGPRVNLRDAARRFLLSRGLLEESETGLCEARVFFAPTREEKLARIADFHCDAFVDDLPEVFSEPGFPRGVRKLLYDRARSAASTPDLAVCESWDAVATQLFPDSA